MSQPIKIIQARSEKNPSAAMYWLLVSLFVFEYLRLQSFVPAIEILHVPFVLGVILGMYWLIKGDKRVLTDSLIKLFIVFILLCASSVLFAVNTFLPYKNTQLLTIFLFTVVLPFIFIVGNEQRLHRFIPFWVWIHAGLAALAITKGGTGSGGFLEDENDLALALDMAVPYAWYLATVPGAKLGRKLVYFSIFGLLIVGIVTTISRGGFVGLVAVIALIIFQSEKPIRNMFLILIVGMVLLYIFIPQSYFKEVESIADTTDSTRLDRFYLWTRAVEMFEDNPVLGVGSGNFPMRVAEYETKSLDFDPYTMHMRGGRVAHSLYFTLLSEYGLAGVLLYVGMVAIILRRLLRIIREGSPKRELHVKTDAAVSLARAMLQSLAAFLVAGAFITVLVYQHFWYLIGFVIALDQAVRNRRSPDDGPDDRHVSDLTRA